MLIHVRKIFNCKVSSNVVVKAPRNCCERNLKIAVIKLFQNGTFKKITILVTEVVLTQLFSYRWF